MTQLNQLSEELKQAQKRLDDDNLFATLLKTCFKVSTLNEISLANELAVSRSTVNRWKNGKAAPHPAMRKLVYMALHQHLVNQEQE